MIRRRAIGGLSGAALLLSVLAVACADDGGEERAPIFASDDARSDVSSPENTEREGWTLVWSDEFDGPQGQIPDPSVWTPEIGIGPNGDGWGNNQLEYNTGRPENASLDGAGNLQITGRREAYQGRAYTSARLITRGSVEQQFGRIEARIQLPEGRGLWPAFWTLGTNISEVGWPSCGEIDIMEFRGQRPSEVLGTIHGPGYSAGESISGETAVSGGLVDDFHVFAIEWAPGRIEWFVDDRPYHTVTPSSLPPGAPWVFDAPHFLLLNLAIGGNFLDNPDGTTPFPAIMLVDYVRIYERDP